MAFKNAAAGFFLFLIIAAILGGIGYGIYKLMKAAGIKPASKKTGDQCALDVECISNKCIFGKCL